jgi:hypothetical protein
MDSSNPASSGRTLNIDNSQIYNCSSIGLLGTTADIAAENLVINNCGQSSLYVRLGGSYNFNNCTISNYFNEGFRQDPAVYVTNGFPQTDLSEPLTEFTFTNGIVYGDRDIELIYAVVDGTAFNVQLSHSLIRFDDRFNNLPTTGVYDFDDPLFNSNILLNQDPDFEAPRDNQLQIFEGSSAEGLGDVGTSTLSDILGRIRGTDPDAGAYEAIPQSE